VTAAMNTTCRSGKPRAQEHMLGNVSFPEYALACDSQAAYPIDDCRKGLWM
jgi:hypothetical protein